MAYTNSPLVTYTRITNNRTSPRRNKIDSIIIHCFVGQVTAQRGVDYFATTKSQSSANYVVGYDGSIGLSVPESDRAWTSGGKDKNGNPIRVNGISGSDFDHRAVTIEVASDNKAPYAVTDAALNSLIKLCADICKRNGIKELKWKNDKSLVGKTEQQNMAVHMWFANKACPGAYLLNKHSYIVNEVNKILKAEEKEEDKKVENKEPSDYAKVSCEKAVNLGIIKGNSSGNFMWHESLTRQDFCVLMDRMGLLK